MWTRVPTADLPGRVCRVPGCLSPSHSIILPPASVLGWVRAEVPIDHGSTTFPFPEWSSLLYQVLVVCSAVFTPPSGLTVFAIVALLVCVGENASTLPSYCTIFYLRLVFILYKDYTKQSYINFI